MAKNGPVLPFRLEVLRRTFTQHLVKLNIMFRDINLSDNRKISILEAPKTGSANSLTF